MTLRPLLAILLLLAPLTTTGCLSAPGTGNFTLVPDEIGWPAGGNATFTLTLTGSTLHRNPSYTIDRVYALEEVRLNERGVGFLGDYRTKKPSDLGFTLYSGNTTVNQTTMDAENPSVTLQITLPEKLRNSQYRLELKLFRVGWVESDVFRVATP